MTMLPLGFISNFAFQLIFIFAVFTSISCSRKAEFHENQPLASFENSSPLLRYETFDPEGHFEEGHIQTDPLRKTYQKTNWSTEIFPQFKSSRVESSTTSMNRVHLVFLGDGYTKAEIPQFRTDIKNTLNKMWAQNPFYAYKNYFAIHIIETPSNESGVSKNGSIKKNTPFDMTYGCYDLPRLLCIDLSKASAAASRAPRSDMIFALANATDYGGAGYLSPAVATMAARHSQSPELAMHEFGHSFAQLSDEYDHHGTGTNCESSPNTSTVDKFQMMAEKSKWFRWLDLANVDSFVGSCYSKSYFRATENSKMRTLGRSFEEVNAEQIIQKIYEKVRPIESATTPGNIQSNKLIQISVLQQLETPLSITWKINGTIQNDLNGRTQVQPSRLNLPSGPNQISVTVVDLTSRVRDETFRKQKMTQTLTWTVQ